MYRFFYFNQYKFPTCDSIIVKQYMYYGHWLCCFLKLTYTLNYIVVLLSRISKLYQVSSNDGKNLFFNFSIPSVVLYTIQPGELYIKSKLWYLLQEGKMCTINQSILVILLPAVIFSFPQQQLLGADSNQLGMYVVLTFRGILGPPPTLWRWCNMWIPPFNINHLLLIYLNQMRHPNVEFEMNF